MSKLWILVGAGVGYVLGAKAGRQRYEQIADQANKVWHNPKVEEKKTQAADLTKKAAGTAGTAAFEKAKETASTAATAAKSKVDEMRGATPPVDSEPTVSIEPNSTPSIEPNSPPS